MRRFYLAVRSFIVLHQGKFNGDKNVPYFENMDGIIVGLLRIDNFIYSCRGILTLKRVVLEKSYANKIRLGGTQEGA